jgi:hypothetical protein
MHQKRRVWTRRCVVKTRKRGAMQHRRVWVVFRCRMVEPQAQSKCNEHTAQHPVQGDFRLIWSVQGALAFSPPQGQLRLATTVPRRRTTNDAGDFCPSSLKASIAAFLPIVLCLRHIPRNERPSYSLALFHLSRLRAFGTTAKWNNQLFAGSVPPEQPRCLFPATC